MVNWTGVLPTGFQGERTSIRIGSWELNENENNGQCNALANPRLVIENSFKILHSTEKLPSCQSNQTRNSSLNRSKSLGKDIGIKKKTSLSLVKRKNIYIV